MIDDHTGATTSPIVSMSVRIAYDCTKRCTLEQAIHAKKDISVSSLTYKKVQVAYISYRKDDYVKENHFHEKARMCGLFKMVLFFPTRFT